MALEDAIRSVLSDTSKLPQEFLDYLTQWQAINPISVGALRAPMIVPTGTTGATQPCRLVGATTAGPPTSGSFRVGDVVASQDGSIYICTVAGSPGTWSRGVAGELDITQTAGSFALVVRESGDTQPRLGIIGSGLIDLSDGTTIDVQMGRQAAGLFVQTLGKGVGYGTGTGGAVTQLTSKSQGVTLNTACGRITMNNAALAANTAVAFGVTNSAVAANDTVILNAGSGFLNYRIEAYNISAGSFSIRVTNISAGSLSEAVTINFAVLKAAAS